MSYTVSLRILGLGFIGSPPMNLFECSLVEEEAFLDTGEFNLEIDRELASAIMEKSSSSELLLGVRPEDITVVKGHLGKTDIPAEIYVLEPYGESTIVDLKVGRYLPKARAPAGLKGEIGEKVGFSIDKAKIHIFDKKTDQLLL